MDRGGPDIGANRVGLVVAAAAEHRLPCLGSAFSQIWGSPARIEGCSGVPGVSQAMNFS